MNIIRQAIELMEESGMTKFVVEDAQGRFCVFGAVNHVTSASASWSGLGAFKAMERIGEVASEQFPTRVRYCPGFNGDLQSQAINFNNHIDTTWEDMRGVMDKAAVRLDEEVALA